MPDPMIPTDHAAEALKLIQPGNWEGDNLDTFQVAIVDAARAQVHATLAQQSAEIRGEELEFERDGFLEEKNEIEEVLVVLLRAIPAWAIERSTQLAKAVEVAKEAIADG